MSKLKKMNREDALNLVRLVRTADHYFRHPDVVSILGFQDSTRISMNLEEVAGYIEDHVIDEEGEGLTTRDRKTIAGALRAASSALDLTFIRTISFALPTRSMAARLREASSEILRKS